MTKTPQPPPGEQVAPTPGPYTFHEDVPNGQGRWMQAPEGHSIREVQRGQERRFGIRSSVNHMARVFGSCEGGHLAEIPVAHGEEGRQQALANAKLFAAADDLANAFTHETHTVAAHRWASAVLDILERHWDAIVAAGEDEDGLRSAYAGLEGLIQQGRLACEKAGVQL